MARPTRTKRASRSRPKAKPKVDPKKAASLLRQLQRAGVNVARDPAPSDVKTLRKRSRLTPAAINRIGKAKDIDFTAWGAWTLRF